MKPTIDFASYTSTSFFEFGNWDTLNRTYVDKYQDSIRFNIRVNNISVVSLNANNIFWKAGELHHIAVTWGANGCSLYIDNRLIGTKDYTGCLGIESSFKIIPADSDKIIIDEFKIWKRQKTSFPTYSIKGKVTEEFAQPISGVNLILKGPFNATYTTTLSGTYSFSQLLPGSYTLLPVPTDLTFSPACLTGEIVDADKEQDFLAQKKDTTPPEAIKDMRCGSTTISSVLLYWTATGDSLCFGTASTYDIRYSTSPITEENFKDATQCQDEPQPLPAGSFESFVVTNLNPGTTYYFAIKVKDDANNWSGISNIGTGNTRLSSPKGLVALPNNQSVALSWNPNLEPNIAGYKVYRRQVGTLSTIFYDDFSTDTTSLYTCYSLSPGTGTFAYNQDKEWVECKAGSGYYTLISRKIDIISKLSSGFFECRFYPYAWYSWWRGPEIKMYSGKNEYSFKGPGYDSHAELKKVVDGTTTLFINSLCASSKLNSWHTIGLQFSPGSITGQFDGTKTLSLSDPEAVPITVDTIEIKFANQDDYLDDIKVSAEKGE
ncbi:MAG: hypothetical protein AAB267_07710, partial [Candidatus Desantisbacteria bacterium]